MIVYFDLHGGLRRAARGRDGHAARVEVPDGAAVADVVAALGLGADEVWRVACDGEFVELTRPVREGEQLVIFPPLGGG